MSFYTDKTQMLLKASHHFYTDKTQIMLTVWVSGGFFTRIYFILQKVWVSGQIVQRIHSILPKIWVFGRIVTKTGCSGVSLQKAKRPGALRNPHRRMWQRLPRQRRPVQQRTYGGYPLTWEDCLARFKHRYDITALCTWYVRLPRSWSSEKMFLLLYVWVLNAVMSRTSVYGIWRARGSRADLVHARVRQVTKFTRMELIPLHT